MKSPSFVVDAIEGSKWRLQFYPRGGREGNYVGYFLHREADSKGAFKVKINYELAFIAKDGSVLKSSGIRENFFSKGQGYGFDNFLKNEEYSLKRSTFLPEDTLRARCRMWKGVGEMAEDVRCTAYTLVGVEKRTFRWNIRNFSTLKAEKKYNYQIKSTETDAPLMSIGLSLTGGVSSEEIIHFDLSLYDGNIKLSTLLLYLVDASGNKIECNRDAFWFYGYGSKQFTFSFTKWKLLGNKSVYLPDDILSLYWEWVFSKGVVSEETEEVQYGPSIYEKKIPDV